MIKSSVSASTTTTKVTPQIGWRNKVLGWLAVILALTLLWAWLKPKPQINPPAVATINESRKICLDAWEQEQDHVNDHRTEKNLPYFDVVLTTDDCFGGDVWRPDDWHTWEKEFVSDEPDAHVSFWFHGWNPIGPYRRNNLPEFDYPPSKQFRLKGKGIIRYFRTS